MYSQQITKRYELDFRERVGRMGYKVQTSVKNFQMTLEVTFRSLSSQDHT
jgi:tubby-related protein 1